MDLVTGPCRRIGDPLLCDRLSLHRCQTLEVAHRINFVQGAPLHERPEKRGLITVLNPILYSTLTSLARKLARFEPAHNEARVKEGRSEGDKWRRSGESKFNRTEPWRESTRNDRRKRVPHDSSTRNGESAQNHSTRTSVRRSTDALPFPGAISIRAIDHARDAFRAFKRREVRAVRLWRIHERTNAFCDPSTDYDQRRTDKSIALESFVLFFVTLTICTLSRHSFIGYIKRKWQTFEFVRTGRAALWIEPRWRDGRACAHVSCVAIFDTFKIKVSRLPDVLHQLVLI